MGKLVGKEEGGCGRVSVCVIQQVVGLIVGRFSLSRRGRVRCVWSFVGEKREDFLVVVVAFVIHLHERNDVHQRLILRSEHFFFSSPSPVLTDPS